MTPELSRRPLKTRDKNWPRRLAFRYGELLPGHGGMMDRIDSLCFAAPVFFHLTRYFYT